MAMKILAIEGKTITEKFKNTDVQVQLAYILLCIVLICLVLLGNFKKENYKVKGSLIILLTTYLFIFKYGQILK
jgi:hypothetical protein